MISNICHFRLSGCLYPNQKAKQAWIQRSGGEWANLLVCDGCFHALEASSIVSLRNPPAEEWIQALFRNVRGDKDGR